MEGASNSFTKSMLMTTLQEARQGGVFPFFVSRGYGSCGVASSSLTDAVCEIFHLATNAVAAPCYAFKGILATGGAVLTLRDWQTPLVNNASHVARKTVAAFQHFGKAGQHIVGVPVAFACGALAPEKLLLPAMRLLDIAGDIDDPDPLWKRVSTILRGSLLGVGVGFLVSRLSSYHWVPMPAASLGQFVVSAMAIGGLMATCYALGRYQRQPPRHPAPPQVPQPPQVARRLDPATVQAVTRLAENWQAMRICPITQEEMRRPVMTRCGHFFEKEAIERAVVFQLRTRATAECPLCRQEPRPLTTELTGVSRLMEFVNGMELALRASVEDGPAGAGGVAGVDPTPSFGVRPLVFTPSFFLCNRPFMELKPDDVQKEEELVRLGYSRRVPVQRETFKDISATGGLISYVRINAFAGESGDSEVFLGSDDKQALNALITQAGFRPNPQDCMGMKGNNWTLRMTNNRRGEEVEMGVFVAREPREKQFAWALIKDGINVPSDRAFVQTLINTPDWRQAVNQHSAYVDRQRQIQLDKQTEASRRAANRR